MKCAIARPRAPSRTRAIAALLAPLVAAGLATRSATAQELEPLPPPPVPTLGPGEVAPGAAPSTVAPAPPATPPPPPAGAPRSGPSEVHFEPDEPDVALLRLSNAIPVERAVATDFQRWYALYSPVCQGPCATHLEAGANRLALAKGGRIVPVNGPVVIDGPATLHGQYVDRSGLRATGLVIGLAGSIGGFVMVVASAQSRAVCDVNGICVSTGMTNAPLLASGVSVLVVSAVVGSILTFQHDSARITVEPLAPGRASREGVLTALDASRPQGAALALHF